MYKFLGIILFRLIFGHFYPFYYQLKMTANFAHHTKRYKVPIATPRSSTAWTIRFINFENVLQWKKENTIIPEGKTIFLFVTNRKKQSALFALSIASSRCQSTDRNKSFIYKLLQCSFWRRTNVHIQFYWVFCES